MKNIVAYSFAPEMMAISIFVSGTAVALADTIYEATIGEVHQKTGEVSTAQMRDILASGDAIVLDTRTHEEFVNGHIPNAEHVTVPQSRRSSNL